MASDSIEASFKLQDRTAVITGPCNTTNQSIAMRFTQLGANVVLMDRNIEKTQRFASQLMDAREVQERYGRAVAVQADLSKLHHVQDGISRAAEAFGGIDIFIDGLMTTEVKSFKDPTALDELERLVDVNIRSPLLVTHAILRFLEGRRRGRIIYLMQDMARLGMVDNSLMAITRTGLSAFVRSLAREVASSNVTVNCVAIGLTEEFLMVQGGPEYTSIQDVQKRIQTSFPYATMTEPDRISNTVAFLASPLGIGITGQTIAVSQGLSLMS